MKWGPQQLGWRGEGTDVGAVQKKREVRRKAPGTCPNFLRIKIILKAKECLREVSWKWDKATQSLRTLKGCTEPEDKVLSHL